MSISKSQSLGGPMGKRKVPEVLPRPNQAIIDQWFEKYNSLPEGIEKEELGKMISQLLK